MTLDNSFEVRKYDFNTNVFNEFSNLHYAKDLWPIVYILSDGSIKEAYVGETTDVYARLSTHLKNSEKKKLTAVHLINSEKFNKSATLDIESNLIKYLSGDGQYRLMNANPGLANHNYYQKRTVYWDIFVSIWDKLRAEGIAKHPLDYIDNSDLFKYSPYKSLTKEQKDSLIIIIKNLLHQHTRTIIVEGGAGTGKTILATFLFKLLNTPLSDFFLDEFNNDESEFIRLIADLKIKYPNPKMALVVPMSSFRKTLKKVFKNVKGLNSNMVIGPADVASEKFDIIVVDESHRLRRRTNLGTYFAAFDKACEKLNLNKNECSELDWINQQADTAILFYDENQSIKPSDVRKEKFDALKQNNTAAIIPLKSQFRVKGGNDYVKHIDNLLNCNFAPTNKEFISNDYEFLLFDSLTDMIREIKLRNEQNGLSRLVAGYSWKWISKQNKDEYDIKIDDVNLRWNSVAEDWVNSENSINEVGCIHTTQGYDLNYTGVIFGNEISFDGVNNDILIAKENYFDINGKNSITDPSELKRFIINIYKTMMLRGIKGTYVYVCDKQLRKYFSQHISAFKTRGKVSVVPQNKIVPFVNAVPIYDLEAAAGSFSDLQKADDFVDNYNWIEIPSHFKSLNDLFACKVVGDSMNKVIPNGSICLFRKYTGGSRNGEIVLVQHTSIQDADFGSGYTVKEYRSKKNTDGDQWNHNAITLKPLSYDPTYKNIEIAEDELSDLKVIGIFEMVLQ